ncbi:hypothetical protein [Streptosporangium sp. NPDC087985]|uniref:hypothetical protein n=1 Tax=Streptosporangium sp. NPDC087985 TaxID=3366196 RepID=UPI00382F1362
MFSPTIISRLHEQVLLCQKQVEAAAAELADWTALLNLAEALRPADDSCVGPRSGLSRPYLQDGFQAFTPLGREQGGQA